MVNNDVNNIITSCNKKFNISLAVALIISFLILFFNINIVLKIFFAVCFFFAKVMNTADQFKVFFCREVRRDGGFLRRDTDHALHCGGFRENTVSADGCFAVRGSGQAAEHLYQCCLACAVDA